MREKYKITSKEKDYINNGILGLNYLLKYIETGNNYYLQVVKNNINEVRFWLMINLYINNHDKLFDSIPYSLLEKIYNKVPLERRKSILILEDGSNFDYGEGYYSSVIIDNYRDNFKLIRNHIAHGEYLINDEGLIEIIDSNIKMKIDIKWLETLVLCCLSNKESCFYKGLSRSGMELINTHIGDKNELYNYLKKRKIVTMTITTSSKEKLLDLFRLNDEDEINMGNLFYSFQKYERDCNLNPSNEKQILDCDKKFMKFCGNNIIIERRLLNYNEIPSEKMLEIIASISDKKLQMTTISNIISMITDNITYNTLSYKYLVDLLMMLKKCDIDNIPNIVIPKYNVAVTFNTEKFIIKTLSIILLSNILENSSIYNDIEKYLASKIDSYISLVKTREILKEDYEELNKSLKDFRDYNMPVQERLISDDIAKLEKLINDFNNDNYKVPLLYKIRNAMVHDQIELTSDEIILKCFEKVKKYKRFNKNKNKWYDREIDKQKQNFELRMNKYEFINLLNEIYSKLGIKTEVNISKYLKRR